LGHNEQAWTLIRTQKLFEGNWHCSTIMGNQHTTLPRRQGQYIDIRQKPQAGCGRGLEINLRLTTQNSRNYVFVEVSVRLKAYFHRTLKLADFFSCNCLCLSLPGIFKLFVQVRIYLASLRAERLKFPVILFHAGIHKFLMAKIVSNGPVNFFQF
jgi:hypothetical protein